MFRILPILIKDRSSILFMLLFVKIGKRLTKLWCAIDSLDVNQEEIAAYRIRLTTVIVIC